MTGVAASIAVAGLLVRLPRRVLAGDAPRSGVAGPYPDSAIAPAACAAIVAAAATVGCCVHRVFAGAGPTVAGVLLVGAGGLAAIGLTVLAWPETRRELRDTLPPFQPASACVRWSTLAFAGGELMVEVIAQPGQRTCGPSRIALHDYCGHPFQFDLSRELARRGHEVRHFFFAEDMGPKGNTRRLSSDPANFSIEAISIGRPYSKQNLVRRRQADILYGELASRRIASFAPDVTISGNTPLEAQAPILKGVRRAGSAFVFWMQDFYSLAAAKILSRKIPVLGHAIGAYYRHLEASMLRRSDGIVLASEDFKPALEDFGVKRRCRRRHPELGRARYLAVAAEGQSMGDAAPAFRQVRLPVLGHPGAEAQSGSAVGSRRAFRE